MQDPGGKAPWRTLDATLAFHSQLLRGAHAMWEERRIALGRLPHRGDFSAREFMRFAGNISLIDVEREPLRFRFRLIGSTVTDRLSRDHTGQYVDTAYQPTYYEAAIAGYLYCLSDKLSIRSFGYMAPAGKDFLAFESVDLPLSADGAQVSMIVKCSDFPTDQTW
ncbi:MAG: hypothetical protein RIB84_06730 [Sneathiellaceae bacterium]